MKITTKQLRSIIKEEISRLHEGFGLPSKQEMFEEAQADGWEFGGLVKGSALAKGMKVAGMYRSTNAGIGFYEVLGVTDDTEKYGEGGAAFDSVKECMAAKGAKSLKALYDIQNENEYGHGSYLVARDIVSGEEGAWFYLTGGGRWCRGSGAEALTFLEITGEKETGSATGHDLGPTGSDLDVDDYAGGHRRRDNF
jgi:hypothetical protein